MTEGTVRHTVDPIYDSRSRVLLLGTMPSPRSRSCGFYYAHPQNRFWRVLPLILGEPAPEDIPGRRALLLRRRIALWDVLQSCDIAGAADASIRNPVPNDLSPIFGAGDIRAVFTTGRKAYELYQRHCPQAEAFPAVCLPSTSAANARYSLEHLAEAYRVIADYL